jgi:predicted ATPase
MPGGLPTSFSSGRDAGDRLAANFTVSVSNVHLGNLAQARQHSEEAIRFFGDMTDAAATHRAFEYGVELGAGSYAYGAWCFWLLGYADQALQSGNEALTISRRIPHDYSRARGLYWNSVLHAYRSEWPIVEERAAAAIASAREHGFPMVVAVSRIMQGSARAMLDPRAEFVAEIQEALAAYRATGARFQSTYHLILLAQALAACGRYREGLDALHEAEALVEETGERYVDSPPTRQASVGAGRERLRGGRERLLESAGGGACTRGPLPRIACRL